MRRKSWLIVLSLPQYHVEKSVFYADVREATKTVSLLLFGPENAEDFVAAQGGMGKDE